MSFLPNWLWPQKSFFMALMECLQYVSISTLKELGCTAALLFFFSPFFHQWRIHHSPWSIFILVLNINPINLLANFVAFALVGHSMVLNLFSSDNCENDGIKGPSFSNKIDLSLEKRGHWTKKWNFMTLFLTVSLSG